MSAAERCGFVQLFLDETVRGRSSEIDAAAVDAVAQRARGAVRDGGGRLFILGVGGSAGHASHAVNDFRKICGFEAYAPTDNVSELTARVNDEGWDTSFSEWLKVSRLGARDGAAGLLGRRRQPREERLDQPRARARARQASVGAQVFGIVGRDGGSTKAARRRLRRHPDRLARSHHAAHRGALRRGLAPARQPPRAQARADEVGIDQVATAPRRRASRRGHARCLHRRAAPASSAATSPTTCWPTRRCARRHPLRQLLVGPRVALRPARRRRAPARRARRRRGRSTRCARAMDGHDVVIHLASNPDIARAATEPDIDFRAGHRAHPQRRRGDAAPPSAKRILYASGSGVYGDLGDARGRGGPRPALAGLDLRREQAGGRGADRELRATCSGSPAAPSASATSSARARPTAWASTSCAGCCADPTRAAHPGRRQQSKSYIHVDRRRARGAAGRTTHADAVPRLQRRDRRLHHGARDRRRWRSSASACGASAVRFDYTGGDRGWKGDVPDRAPRHAAHPARSAGAAAMSTREALRRSILAMIPDLSKVGEREEDVR